MKQGQPWRTDIVEGQPIKVGTGELIPVVKVRSIVRRGVTFGTQASRGSGGGLIWLQPLAVIERHPDGSERRIPIRDGSGEVIKTMLVGALALPVLYLLVVAFMFLWRKSR
jgi:uncharacterized spore protein YtfJ